MKTEEESGAGGGVTANDGWLDVQASNVITDHARASVINLLPLKRLGARVLKEDAVGTVFFTIKKLRGEGKKQLVVHVMMTNISDLRQFSAEKLCSSLKLML
jgi:hypothetical protein